MTEIGQCQMFTPLNHLAHALDKASIYTRFLLLRAYMLRACKINQYPFYLGKFVDIRVSDKCSTYKSKDFS